MAYLPKKKEKFADMKQKIERLFFLSFLGVLIGITVLSVLPPKQVELGSQDKIGHFIAYAALMLSFGLWKSEFRIQLIGCFCFCVYGIFMEWVQGFVPGRVPSLLDIVANVIGLFIGIGLIFLVRKIFFFENEF